MMNSLKMKKVKLKWLKKQKIKQNLVKLPRENEEKNLFFAGYVASLIFTQERSCTPTKMHLFCT